MKILAIYQHYWPDTTPYARLLRTILEDRVTHGHSASVFTAQPGYNDVRLPQQKSREELGGVDIRRIWLLPERKRLRPIRLLNYVYFLFRAFVHVLCCERYDLIIANTQPPVMIGLVLRLIKRLTNTEYVLHCQDIHPESAIMAGQIRATRFAELLTNIDATSCSEALRVVTLSKDMRETLCTRAGGCRTIVEVINNFPLDIYDTPNVIPEIFQRNDSGKFRVLFSGNMGLFQDLARLIKAAHIMREIRQIQFVFMGAGAQYESLRCLARDLIDKTVFFEPFQPAEVAFECMKRSDLGVVSLKDGVCKLAYPSKTMTYLSAGCPLFALTERDSQIANDIVSERLGYVPSATTPQGIAEALLNAFDNRADWCTQSRLELSVRAARLFGREKALADWNLLFSGLSKELESRKLRRQPHANMGLKKVA